MKSGLDVWLARLRAGGPSQEAGKWWGGGVGGAGQRVASGFHQESKLGEAPGQLGPELTPLCTLEGQPDPLRRAPNLCSSSTVNVLGVPSEGSSGVWEKRQQ